MSEDRILFFVLGSAFALTVREVVGRLRARRHPNQSAIPTPDETQSAIAPEPRIREEKIREEKAMAATVPIPPEPPKAEKKIAILPVTTDAEIKTTRELFVEYGQSLGFSLCFQSFDQEYASLPGKYAPPRGRLLLAEVDGTPAGCVALRPLETGVCEMKRLYVRPEFRGLKLGRRLAETIIHEAKLIGYQAMRLDTIEDKMQSAVALYRALGFHEIGAYTANPVEGAIFLEIDLVPTPQLSLYGDAE
jgi:ribosomal protein S18 acetylase RimI-like enzyme